MMEQCKCTGCSGNDFATHLIECHPHLSVEICKKCGKEVMVSGNIIDGTGITYTRYDSTEPFSELAVDKEFGPYMKVTDALISRYVRNNFHKKVDLSITEIKSQLLKDYPQNLPYDRYVLHVGTIEQSIEDAINNREVNMCTTVYRFDTEDTKDLVVKVLKGADWDLRIHNNSVLIRYGSHRYDSIHKELSCGLGLYSSILISDKKVQVVHLGSTSPQYI